MKYQDILGSNCERMTEGAWDIIFPPGLATTDFNPIENLFGCAGEEFTQQSVPIINAKSWQELCAKMDEDKCGDVA